MIGIAILSVTILGAVLGLVLGYAGRIFKVESNPLVDEVEQMLPGSQCGQCGFPGCRPAAEAVVDGNAPITMCPPGGRSLAEKLSEKLGIEADLSDMEDSVPKLASVRESTCIGCTRCFKVCPTDAIVGAPKQIHTVIADACTGCGKCVEICPTECFSLNEFEVTLRNWRWHKPEPAAARTAA